MMGSPDTEVGRSDDESQVDVRITNPFGIGRTVVTQDQWQRVIGTTPWLHPHAYATVVQPSRATPALNQCGPDYPAVYVNWHEAMLFCDTLTELERQVGILRAGQRYRLPTEAEWEYACRAGTTTRFFFGDAWNQLDDYGWHHGNSGGIMHEVCCKTPNPWGLHDMYGNISEWCADVYDEKLTGGDDPSGPAVGTCHVIRGGLGAQSLASQCRSASRHFWASWHRLKCLGFRVVCCPL